MGKLKDLVNAEKINKLLDETNKGCKILKPALEAWVLANDLVLKATANQAVRQSIIFGLEKIADVIETEALRITVNHKKDFKGDFVVVGKKMKEHQKLLKEAREEERKRREEERAKRRKEMEEEYMKEQKKEYDEMQ